VALPGDHGWSNDEGRLDATACDTIHAMSSVAIVRPVSPIAMTK
jgi:hypothetical protein